MVIIKHNNLYYLLKWVLLAAGLFLFYLLWSWNRPLVVQEQVLIVEPGTTLHALGNRLINKGVIQNKQSFILLAYLRGHSRSLRAGEYRLEKGLSSWGLLDKLVSGKGIDHAFVIIEGWNFREILTALEKAKRLQHTLKDLTQEEIMNNLGATVKHPEGWFFPDTYYYSAGTKDISILERAYNKMQDRLELEWAQREDGLPLKSAYEALTLASIVEKETGLVSERPLIAGVFINRLRKGMRLQTDPTVIYGLGEKFDGNLRRRDLLKDGPYNTYRRSGLPPTPIAMPGGDAIHAVLHPDKTRALYFVSRGFPWRWQSQVFRYLNRTQ